MPVKAYHKLVRADKTAKRGGFENRIFLKEVQKKEPFNG